MNILYYIPDINQQMGGLRQYAVALLKILLKDKENKYFIYHEINDPEIMNVLAKNPHHVLIKRDKWEFDKIRVKRKVTAKTGISLEINDNKFIDKICSKFKIGIVHCPYQYLPETKIPKLICTMHDVQELHFPEYFTAESRAERAVKYLKYIRGADKIIVSYTHVKQDIIKYFNTPANIITVCLLEMDNLWIDKYTDKDIISLRPLGIDGDFVIYPANTWQHKNHIKLLEALAILKQQSYNNIKLVCTGHKTPYFDDCLQPFIEQNNLENQVIFPGVLDEVTLYSLYKTCLGVVVPTIYEAGSFPVMEAILLNVPVICSNVTSLPETIGDDSFIFDPLNAQDIANKLLKLWGDDEYRQRSIANGSKQAGRLRNTDALNVIKSVYSELATTN